MKTKHTSFLLFLAAFLTALFLHGCWFSNSPCVGGCGDTYKPPQTNILKVLVQPDTVAPGDTARFICIIKDSTDKRFHFDWIIDSGEILEGKLIIHNPPTYRTNTNSIRWIAPDSTGHLISFTVTVNNESKDSAAVDDSFTIFIKGN
jgi:hypothetical protein